MAAPASAIPIPAQLCDYCHQKPKHGSHPYCSKTCAAQIAALCNHCHQKPKFQNFEYCGKNCAAADGKATGTAGAGNGTGTGNRPAKNGVKTTASGGGPGTTTIGGVTIDPIQLAKLVAQHIPQVQHSMSSVAPVFGQGQAQSSPNPPNPPVVSQRVVPAPKNNPFINNGASLAAKQSSTASPVVLPATSSFSTPAAPNGAPMPIPDCLIPGCGQIVHVDATSGNMSEYCSRKHREEAVTLGLVAPCIMCLVLPQSDTDYFCGRECREEALSKNVPIQP
ncbi:hypothetical protein C8F01DRAFT_664462 [Mycena amicta]|nr:hypothetical protein C8F01DRAFT_664462 [Mycena amicta]